MPVRLLSGSNSNLIISSRSTVCDSPVVSHASSSSGACHLLLRPHRPSPAPPDGGAQFQLPQFPDALGVRSATNRLSRRSYLPLPGVRAGTAESHPQADRSSWMSKLSRSCSEVVSSVDATSKHRIFQHKCGVTWTKESGSIHPSIRIHPSFTWQPGQDGFVLSPRDFILARARPQTEAKESRGAGGWGTNDDPVFAQEFPECPTIFVGRFSGFRDVSVVSSQCLAQVVPLELLDGHRL